MKRFMMVLKSLFWVMFLVGPIMKITERVAYAYHYKLEPLGILGLFICGIGIFGLTIVLLIDEWYFPDAHKPQID